MSTATTWSSVLSTDANLGTNYSAGLPADAVVTLSNVSVINWIFTANMSVESITIAATYTGVVTMTGFTLTCSLGFSDDGITGAHTYGTALNCAGASSTLHVGAGLASLTADACKITMSGATGMTMDIDIAVVIKVFIITGIVTVTNGALVTVTGTSTTGLQVSGTFTVNAAIKITNTSAKPWSLTGAYVLNGTGNITFNNNGGDLDAMTYTGSGIIILTTRPGSVAYTMNGDFNLGTAGFSILKTGTGVISLTCGAFGITCGTFTPGNSNATETLTVNFGSGTHSFQSFSGAGSRVGAVAMNFSTAQISCAGNWTFVAADTITTGSFLLTITNTSSVTSAGKSFFDLTINCGANTVTCIAALTLAAGGDLTLTAGTLNLATFNLTVGGNTAINGTSTLNATGSTCSFAGNYTTAAGSTVTINAATNYTFTAAAIVTTNGKALPQCTFNAAFSINDSCTIARLIWGVDGFTGTFEAGNTFTISNLAAANWSGAAAALNAVRSSVPGTQFTLVLPNAATLTFYDSQDCIYQGFDITANNGTSITRGNNVRYLTMNVVTVLPITGTTAGGTLLTFTDTGNGMGGVMVVTVGGAGAGAETVVDTQHSTAVTPAGAAGIVNIVITNGDNDTRTLVGGYTYVTPAAGGGPIKDSSRCYIAGAAIGI